MTKRKIKKGVCDVKSNREGARRVEEMQMGMFLWALRKDLG